MEGNRAALLPAVHPEQAVNPPMHNTRHESIAAEKPVRAGVNFFRSPTVAVIESALLMLLIGWIDYVTDFNVTVFYFVPVVLTTWRAGRKAGRVIAVLLGATGALACFIVR